MCRYNLLKRFSGSDTRTGLSGYTSDEVGLLIRVGIAIVCECLVCHETSAKDE